MGTIQSSYVGIDPSLKKTGVGAVSLSGVSAFLMFGKHKEAQRLTYLRDMLKTHLEFLVLRYGPIKHVCIEGAAHAATNRADAQGQLRGVLAVCAADFCENVTYVPPSTLKLYATGNGGASKEKMIKAAHTHWDLSLSDDEADAMWLAHLARALAEDPPLYLKRYQMEVIHGIRNPKVKRRISTRHANNV
jgi:Holliday junction resolvasome RuvABC endonuclease subunit